MLFVIALLKIWGTLLLIRVILVLVLLLLLLLVPFRYRLHGQSVIEKGDKQEIEEEIDRIKKGQFQACFQVKWLFRFLNVEAKICKEDNLGICFAVRAMGEEVMSFADSDVLKSEASDDEKESQTEELTDEVKMHLDKEDAVKKDDVNGNIVKEDIDDTDKDIIDVEAVETENDFQDNIIQESKLSGDIQEHQNLESQNEKKDVSKGLGDFLYNLAVLRDKYEYFDEVIHQKESLQAMESLKKRIIKLLLSILPKKMNGEIIVGTGEPDSTGMIYGVYCSLFFPRFYPSFVIIPEFDHLALDGEVDITGKICIGTILVSLIGFVIDSQIRELYGKLKLLKEKDAAEWERQVKKMQRTRNGGKRRKRRAVKPKVSKEKSM